MNFDKSSKLLRSKLGSITAKEIEEIKGKQWKTREERMAYAGDVEGFYKRVFEAQLKEMIQAQLEFIGKQATDEEQFQFGRGTLNGLLLVKEWFTNEVSYSKSKDEAEEEDSNPFPSVE